MNFKNFISFLNHSHFSNLKQKLYFTKHLKIYLTCFLYFTKFFKYIKILFKYVITITLNKFLNTLLIIY